MTRHALQTCEKELVDTFCILCDHPSSNPLFRSSVWLSDNVADFVFENIEMSIRLNLAGNVVHPEGLWLLFAH